MTSEINMKLYSVEYLGFTAMDKRFSRPMLPWVIAEIKRRASTEKVCLGIHDGLVQAFSRSVVDSGQQNPAAMFQHSLQNITRFSHAYNNHCTFMYLLRDPVDPLLYCYLYQASDPNDVVELFNAMRDQSKDGNMAPSNGRSFSSAAALTSLCADISPSSSHFFEVLYIGKIKVSHKKVPESFIDDALEKFRVHELEKGKGKMTKQGSSHNISTAGASAGSNGHINQSGAPGNSIVMAICRDEEQTRRGSQDSCSGDVETADNLNMVSPTVLSPMVPSTNNKQLGDSIEAINVIPQSESNLVMPIRQHSQPTTPAAAATMTIEELVHNGKTSSEVVPGRTNSTIASDSTWTKQQSLPLEPMRNRAASTGSAKELKKAESTTQNDHNRTMLFQVGRIDLRLISPDRKQILLHKLLKDVASCIQGIKHVDHFGFICREVNVECYIGYVFKCQSESVADDVVSAITQAFLATSEAQRREKLPVLSCEHCPMVWYHKLCTEAEGLNDKRTQATIFRRLELLPEEEQSVILTKFRGAETSSLREQNEFLMMLLRAHCEGKQARHTHDTAENRSEFLNQYLGGSTIFMKAKRSLTSSFDQLLKRKGSRDDFGPIVKELSLPMNAALCKDAPCSSGSASPTTRSSPAPTLEVPESKAADSAANLRPRSSTVGTADGETMKRELQGKQVNGSCNGGNNSLSAGNSQQQLTAITPTKGEQKSSPMMNIFLKVGHTSKTSPTQEPNQDVAKQPGSWRQAIFNRVVTPNKGLSGERGLGPTPKQHPVKRDREELRALWKKAINQQLLLIRMDKENARLKERQEEATVKRIKLEYEEIGSCVREVMEVWDLLVSKESRVSTQCDSKMLLQAIRQGVPRSKRGDVWHFLAEQYCLKVAPIDTTNFPNYHVPYESLLRQLTSHQHAILIDLGRTFPNHTYFSSPLGPGQLALFNLLKAYSLLDHEVGYCQGLSFVAGVLLLHMSEESAFFLLRHLMFRRGLRRQYLPDMAALQVQLYQLSRLLHDQHRDLYDHFEKHEVAPTLYAAPWILTLFASQFPLGFVTRVFDLLFLENTEVIFRVALALLGEHKDGLLLCDSFEEIMEYLKNVVPDVDKKEMLDRIMKQVFTMDVSRQLHEYEVEYHVLQEGMSSMRTEEVEALHKAEAANRTLVQQNQALIEQLEIATSEIHRLEASRTHQQVTVSRLESQVRSLEVSVATMGHFIASLAESNSNIEIPGEIRRVVAQLSVAERRRSTVGQPLLKSSKLDTAHLKATSPKAAELNEDNHSYRSVENGRTHSIGSEIPAKLRGSEDKPREMPYPLKSALSSPNLTTKLSGMSSFFANTHNQIKQQRLNATNNSAEVANNETVTARKPSVNPTDSTGALTTVDGCKNCLLDVAGFEKSNSMPLAISRSKLKSSQSSFELRAGATSNRLIENTQCDSCDSGNVTPTSPILANHVHPLDTCSDVHFTYGGTTKLKTIRPLRAHLSRNSSVDNITLLKPMGPGGDANIITSRLVDSKSSGTSMNTPIGETKNSLITG